MNEYIIIKGARENNLKNIDVELRFEDAAYLWDKINAIKKDHKIAT